MPNTEYRIGRSPQMDGCASRVTLLTFVLCMAIVAGRSGAQAPDAVDRDTSALEQELQQDVLLRAMVDELERSREGVRLAGLAEPYFIEYAVTDANTAWVTAELGAVAQRDERRQRDLRCEVRVGSYELDDTNFSTGRFGGFSFGESFGGAPMPIEDDYEAIRQSLWWSTDRTYKQAAEALEQKIAFMKSKVIENKPDDFSRETPAVHFDARRDLTVSAEPLEPLAVALSRVFRDYPDIQSSEARIMQLASNYYLVNVEGTRLRTESGGVVLNVRASVQAEDGMYLGDQKTWHAEDLEKLPPVAVLERQVRAMAETLMAVRAAPKLEQYTGPVLFEPEAAAQLFAQQYAGRFHGGQRPVGSRSSPDDFANKIGRRILPRFMQVLDDPTLEEVAGVPVMGHYHYDEQGVPAQAVRLVENGKLLTQLMGRNPSEQISRSNGHGRGSAARGSVGCMIVSATDALDDAALRQELTDAALDEGLEYGIRVVSLGSVGESRRGGGAMPLAMYKLYRDGREELVRGAELARVDLKAFKRIMAAGQTPYVYNSAGGGGWTVACPALLFEELDLAKMDRDFDTTPILETPLSRSEE